MPEGAEAFAVQWAARSDRGRVREGNEDAVLIQAPDSPEARARGVLCVVADGMGGHAAGEVASELAVRTVHQQYYRGASTLVVEALGEAIEAANEQIWQEAGLRPDREGMGSTVTAAVIYGDDAVIGQVGDSRAYLVRGTAIEQLTTDHSWVAQQVAAGALSAEEARDHPEQNLLTRALGQQPSVEVDVYRAKLQPGDVLVLCSDGLTKVAADAEIGRLASERPPRRAVESLIRLANERGGPDNVAVAVLRVGGPAAGRRAARPTRWVPILAMLAAVLLVGALVGSTILFGRSGSPAARPEARPATPPPTNDAAAVVSPTSAPPAATPPPPAAGPSPTAQAERGTIGPGGAMLRSTASTTAAALDTLGEGAPVLILRSVRGQPHEGSDQWYEIETDLPRPQRGFIHRSVVRLAGPTPNP